MYFAKIFRSEDRSALFAGKIQRYVSNVTIYLLQPSPEHQKVPVCHAEGTVSVSRCVRLTILIKLGVSVKRKAVTGMEYGKTHDTGNDELPD
jgi:hypothetical protein